MSDCDCTKIGYTYEGGQPSGYRESPCSPCEETCQEWHFPVSGLEGNCPSGDCPAEGSISVSKSGWSGEVPIGVISVTNKSGMAHANYYLQCGADTFHHYWYYLYASIEPIYKFSASFGGGREQEEPVLKYRVGASVLQHNAFGENEGTGVYLLAIDNDGNFQRVGNGVSSLDITVGNKFNAAYLSAQFPDLGPAPQGVPSSPRLPTGLTAAQIGYATYDIRCYDYQSGQSANAYSSEIVRSQRSVYEALDGYVKSGKGDNWRLADLTDLFGVEAVVSNTSTPIETHVGNLAVGVTAVRTGPQDLQGGNTLWAGNKTYTGLDESWIGTKFIHSDYTLGKNGCLKDFQCSFDNEALTWNVAEVNNGGMDGDENGFYVKGTYDGNLYARGLLHCRDLKEFYTSKNKELKAEKTGALVDLFVKSYRDHFSADIPSEQTLAETSGHLVKWITDPASYYGISEEEYEITRCCSGGSIITGYVTGGTTHSCGPFQTLRATGEDVWGTTLYETGCPWPVEEITAFSDNCTGLIEGYVSGSLYFQDVSGDQSNKTGDWQWKYHWSMLDTGLGNIIDTESGHTHETGSQYLENIGFEKTWTGEASGIFCYEVFVRSGKSSPKGELVLHYSGNSGWLDGVIQSGQNQPTSASSTWGTAGKTYIKNLTSPSGNCCGGCEKRIPIKICYSHWAYPGLGQEKYHAGYPDMKSACTSKCESGTSTFGTPSGGHFTGWFIDAPLSNRGYETIDDKNIPKVNSTVYSGSGDNGVVKIWQNEPNNHYYVEDNKYIKIDVSGKVTSTGECSSNISETMTFIANGHSYAGLGDWQTSHYPCRYPNESNFTVAVTYTGDGTEEIVTHGACGDLIIPSVGTAVRAPSRANAEGINAVPLGDWYYGLACPEASSIVGYYIKLNLSSEDSDGSRAGVVTETGKCGSLFPRTRIKLWRPNWDSFSPWPSSGTACSMLYGWTEPHSELGSWSCLSDTYGWVTGVSEVPCGFSSTFAPTVIGSNNRIYENEEGDELLASVGNWGSIGTNGYYLLDCGLIVGVDKAGSFISETGACPSSAYGPDNFAC